jgi:hypothetical protein
MDHKWLKQDMALSLVMKVTPNSELDEAMAGMVVLLPIKRR